MVGSDVEIKDKGKIKGEKVPDSFSYRCIREGYKQGKKKYRRYEKEKKIYKPEVRSNVEVRQR